MQLCNLQHKGYGPVMTLASLDDRHLILFARYPVPGTTKTRLVPALGAAAAALLAKTLTEFALAQARACGCPLTVYGTGASVEQLEQWLGASCELQPTGDLGERMASALAQTYARGARRTLLIGSDCPGITPQLLANGFEALRHHDVVLGPATDGGYYLIGMRAPQPQLFAQMQWSHSAVLAQTLARLEGLTHILLPVLSDIDTPEDLAQLPPGFLP
jgi:uncharacterized protein